MNDPTRQGFVEPPTGREVRLSLGEVASLAHKAARGAGFSWGLCEEVGTGVRWLQAHGLPGLEVLARHLAEFDGEIGRFRPRLDGARWACDAGEHCPILLGVTLSDRMTDDLDFDIGAVAFPLLLIPFLALAARDLDLRFTLAWDADGVVAFNGPTVLSTDWRALAGLARVGGATLRAGVTVNGTGLSRIVGRRAIDPLSLHALQRLAQRTYVPETEASRERGAGSGQPDID